MLIFPLETIHWVIRNQSRDLDQVERIHTGYDRERDYPKCAVCKIEIDTKGSTPSTPA